ncbi:phenylacetyl-CoA ligase, putative [Talaromyces stipitatus ATCC 10500]|uniref:Phenylacetyl-CoA ligase, putative n=1 Tax=Talaromyces stipitatus (strain ATCC 10500 / CBS 375.48 / QM 6759 / NRRL 1006) TaxID=441959 RepID=B8MR39_TALSN|nr:phenylacetyl-CoA ligase, putative [Talaromyces stipitatus ATCC 10500]EED12934.1 phenylacetyl-CoA ligase, putative [Talaromyces stipitatus ATCC 10500]
MVFFPPRSFPPLPLIPDDVAICDFMLDERYGRFSLSESQNPFTCGLSGKSYSWLEVRNRVDYLSRALSKEFNWHPNRGTEWDKVAACFLLNTIDNLSLFWAIHRLCGVATPANAAYSAAELTYQLKDSKATALFTCVPLLETALTAAKQAGIPQNRIYLVDLPLEFVGNAKAPPQFKTLEQLIETGKSLPKVEPLKWGPGQGVRTTAFVCYSSGTSGLPKGVMISHRNVIANSIQICTFEGTFRPTTDTPYHEVVLCLLPQSHIYALVYMCHAVPYRGDGVIVLPKFDINTFLNSIQRFRINILFLVPPIIITMLRNQELMKKYDLSSVTAIFTGAAPLGAETAKELHSIFPDWAIRQGYGLTETATVVCATTNNDIWFGSSGNFLPGVEARLVSPDGNEILEYDTPGELVIRSPSVVLGYLHNEKATKETFRDGWMFTGDEAVIRVGPKGTEHMFIVDRIKELIKVKGLQVAPAELEAHLLEHPLVADCAVIAVPDEAAGEVPKAFVVKSPSATQDDTSIIQAIKKHVEDHKARHKWLKGGVQFLEVIPKSPSGKILRRLLRDQEREARKRAGSKL